MGVSDLEDIVNWTWTGLSNLFLDFIKLKGKELVVKDLIIYSTINFNPFTTC